MTDNDQAADDPTEDIRRQLCAILNQAPRSRQELESRTGPVWNADELQRDFDVIGFGAPFVVARRRSDGVVGSLIFQPQPRLYFSFVPD